MVDDRMRGYRGEQNLGLLRERAYMRPQHTTGFENLKELECYIKTHRPERVFLSKCYDRLRLEVIASMVRRDPDAWARTSEEVRSGLIFSQRVFDEGYDNFLCLGVLIIRGER